VPQMSSRWFTLVGGLVIRFRWRPWEACGWGWVGIRETAPIPRLLPQWALTGEIPAEPRLSLKGRFSQCRFSQCRFSQCRFSRKGNGAAARTESDR
jgi:glycine/D-amino acid oxidase-like deaminating enzyme